MLIFRKTLFSRIIYIACAIEYNAYNIHQVYIEIACDFHHYFFGDESIGS
jgi:hypothetical protein